MNKQNAVGTISLSSPRWRVALAGGCIVLAALAAYHNSFSVPFIFDDDAALKDNPTIRHLGTALWPPPIGTTGGRPVLNLTFAINYALNGPKAWGYHAFNLLVHTLAGLTLFGVVRRTLLRPLLNEHFGADATPLALAVTVIWIVHPIQTESVTYISQRAESLMGFFYLLTLYCFIRSTNETGERPRKTTPVLNAQRSTLSSRIWLVASILACLLGVMSKEVIVTAPVMVLLYDRTFVAGSFRDAWRLRWRYYVGLAGTWLLLARLMTGLNDRGVGFHIQRVTWWNYALTSCRSMVQYGKLVFWPHPLVFDYGIKMVQHSTDIVPYVLIMVALFAVVMLALRYRPPIGFFGAWFFVILAPTTSVVPIIMQPMAEHRLYLSLAAAIALAVIGLYRLAGRNSLFVCVVAAVGLGCLSVQRNQVYHSELNLWQDTVAKCPDNPRAHANLGILLGQHGRLAEAVGQFHEAVGLEPSMTMVHSYYGDTLAKMGRWQEAVAEYQAALNLDPTLYKTHNNFGDDLLQLGRLQEAAGEYIMALRLKPDLLECRSKLGRVLTQMGQLQAAAGEYYKAVQLAPDDAQAHFALGDTLSKLGRVQAAIGEYRAGLHLDPGFADVHYNLGNDLLQLGRLEEAAGEYHMVLHLNPSYAEAHNNLGDVLLKSDRAEEAAAEYREAVRLKPDYAEAHNNLGIALTILNQVQEAVSEYQKAVRLEPDYAEAHNNLGDALAYLGRAPEAAGEYREVLRLQPENAEARDRLAHLQTLKQIPSIK